MPSPAKGDDKRAASNLRIIRLRTHAKDRLDPTRTTMIRTRFAREMGRRFRKLKGDIRKAIEELDGFGLRVNQPAQSARQFAFPRSQDKVAAFMRWLDDAQAGRILEVSRGAPLGQAAERAWTNVYIESAYQKGIAQAGQEMRSQGATVSDRWIDAGFNRPVHADRAGLAYTRTFSELRGITDEMDQQISRTLAEGLSEGRGPRHIARQINQRVDRVGLTRARTLARTETIRAHAEATLNTYEEAGVEGVSGRAEFTTSGDAAVCPICASLEGSIYTLSGARGIIPVHPNCRCSWTPVIDKPERIDLQ